MAREWDKDGEGVAMRHVRHELEKTQNLYKTLTSIWDVFCILKIPLLNSSHCPDAIIKFFSDVMFRPTHFVVVVLTAFSKKCYFS